MARSLDLYIFLYPPPDVAARALDVGQRWAHATPEEAGRWMDASRLHVTVAGLGSYPDEIPAVVVERAIAVGNLIHQVGFDLAFDGVGPHPAFKRGVELTGQAKALRGLRELRRRLKLGWELLAADLDVPLLEQARPHITLLYDSDGTSPARSGPLLRLDEPVQWSAREFCLVVSHNGEARHEILHRWQLAEPPPAFAPLQQQPLF